MQVSRAIVLSLALLLFPWSELFGEPSSAVAALTHSQGGSTSSNAEPLFEDTEAPEEREFEDVADADRVPREEAVRSARADNSAIKSTRGQLEAVRDSYRSRTTAMDFFDPFAIHITPWYQRVAGQVSGPEDTPTGRLENGANLGFQLSAVSENLMVQLTHVNHKSAVTGPYVFRGLSMNGGTVDESLLVLDTEFRHSFYADRDFFFDGTLGLDLVGLRAKAVSTAQSAELNTIAPLPTIGFLTRYRLFESISLRGFGRASNYALKTIANSTYSFELELVYTDPCAGHTRLADQFAVGWKYLSFFTKSDADLPNQAEARFKSMGPTVSVVFYY